jgi:hypothetical protein
VAQYPDYVNGAADDDADAEYAGPGYVTDADEVAEAATGLSALWVVLPVIALAGLAAASVWLRRRSLA